MSGDALDDFEIALPKRTRTADATEAADAAAPRARAKKAKTAAPAAAAADSPAALKRKQFAQREQALWDLIAARDTQVDRLGSPLVVVGAVAAAASPSPAADAADAVDAVETDDEHNTPDGDPAHADAAGTTAGAGTPDGAARFPTRSDDQMAALATYLFGDRTTSVLSLRHKRATASPSVLVVCMSAERCLAMIKAWSTIGARPAPADARGGGRGGGRGARGSARGGRGGWNGRGGRPVHAHERQMIGGCKVAKLFARHIRPVEQRAVLTATNYPVAVGTPARISALLEPMEDHGTRTLPPMSLESTEVVVLDASFVDTHQRTLMNSVNTMDAVEQLLAKIPASCRIVIW
ncbi:hypothetical protein CXG81DRAFT_26148 [Caulochytrium protostelioides]|uniref:Uncharacterized protein n=1 Tax=Caulochytrium protostelioides TaxID=1555241 RepID=A0A4P9X7Z0_9FUNG|nr:hypothetical protein CXG81DRAFT_26148 [Caulochytrium protostelioides]|eukprot:RKP01180.1 hypothetical protein CXG81DRAFT_26148 [Caulochytrium protostelioides]